MNFRPKNTRDQSIYIQKMAHMNDDYIRKNNLRFFAAFARTAAQRHTFTVDVGAQGNAVRVEWWNGARSGVYYYSEADAPLSFAFIWLEDAIGAIPLTNLLASFELCAYSAGDTFADAIACEYGEQIEQFASRVRALIPRINLQERAMEILAREIGARATRYFLFDSKSWGLFLLDGMEARASIAVNGCRTAHIIPLMCHIYRDCNPFLHGDALILRLSSMVEELMGARSTHAVPLASLRDANIPNLMEMIRKSDDWWQHHSLPAPSSSKRARNEHQIAGSAAC